MGNKYLIGCVLLMDGMLGVSSVYHISILATLSTILMFIVLSRGSVTQNFYALLGVSPFFNVFGIGGLGSNFLILAYALLLLLLKNKVKYVSLGLFFLLFFYALNESLYAFESKQVSTFIGSVCSISYMLLLLDTHKFSDYDHRLTTFLYFSSMILCMVFCILNAGDLTQLGDDSQMDIRLGEGNVEEGASNNLGGAMGFPVYTLQCLTLMIPFLMSSTNRLIERLSVASILIVAMVVTFFTTSRVYLLGLGTFALLFLIYCLSHLRKSVKILLSFIIVVGYFIYSNPEFIDLITQRYIFRNEYSISYSGDITTGRTEIWQSILNYLSDYPVRIFTGCGNVSYVTIGRLDHQAFSMSAHNMFLDALMSYGLIGIFAIIYIAKKFIRRLQKQEMSSHSLLAWIPLLVYIVMGQSSSPFLELKNFFTLPFLMLHIVFYQRLQQGMLRGKLYNP